ncbi:hypothetical protein GCM10009623_34580 [Nocardioides aestuarii]
MLALWDAAANAPVDPDQVGSRSSRPRWWRCPVADDHRWTASPSSITRSLANGFTGCPCCAGRQLSITNSFAARYPEAVDLWHPDRNGDLTPDRVLGGSSDLAWWKCAEGPDHEWQVSPLVLGKGAVANGRRGCPFCAGKRASVTNSVATHPQLAAEWHPTANGDLRPEDIVAGTGQKLWWRCLEQPAHEWAATGANRTRGRGCPRCIRRLRSVLEVCLAYELATFLPDLNLHDDTLVVDGVTRHVDLHLRKPQVVIEVDGRYRHAGDVEHDRDARKTAFLENAGYRVLRVREHPLQPIGPHDVMVPTDATVKETTDAVLLRLRELDWVPLDADTIDDYLAEDEPRHVDEALTYLQVERPGKTIRLPGPVTFTRESRWEAGLRVLEAYVAREEHANVPWEHVEDGVPLGRWVGAKRAQRRRGRMPADRAATLEALPGWVWDAVGDQWEQGLLSLTAFRQREGHLDVPAQFWDEDGFPLGSWVRSHRRDGGRRTMTTDQRTRLEAVPGWTYTSPTQTAWDASLEALRAFADRRTPRQHREAGVNIDGWSKQQRARYHRGELPAERVQQLEAVTGWSWRPQDDAWEAGWAALTEHVRRTGTALVRRDATPHGYPLGAWVGEQRVRYTAGDLPQERQQRLETLAGWSWHPHADLWERHFEALEQFVAREGHARVPTDHIEGDVPLADWVIRHRQEFKAGLVPADRAARLEALPDWTWDVLASRWEKHYTALEAFAAREGHAQVPTDHLEADLKLGRWVVVQRQTYRKGDLAPDRADRLARTPGWVWDTRDAAWEKGFDALTGFQARNGHCRVPGTWLEDGYRLGQWVTVQRNLIRTGKLADMRRDRLAAIPGWERQPSTPTGPGIGPQTVV